ncbi:MAG TPA: ABC transporter permease [Chitinophagaceae bacterium]|nr:ABC transporter permease [Chitinophagaceae bacterium]
MFRNYVKIALRNLRRDKAFSAINILGLALGIATCLLITIYVQNELSYDRYNKNADRIVRVTFRGVMESGTVKEANVMPPVAAAFKKDFPEVLEATRIRPVGSHKAVYGEKSFRDDPMAFVDSNFFRVFTLPLLKGNEATALLKPNTIVLSAAAAKKYFGTENPVGKVLEFPEDHASLTVTGMFDKVPDNSHFHFDMLASMATLPEAWSDSWMSSNFFTYLLLPKGYDYKKLQAKLPGEIDKYIGPQLQKGLGLTLAQFRQKGNSLNFYLQPLTDIHLKSDLTGDMEPYGNIEYVYIFSAVAIFMLLIACINFMNLSTAGASRRSREVGIRKVMGSLKRQLIKQFLTESLLLTAVAMLIAIGLVYWALPMLNSIAGKDLHFNLFSNPWVLPGLLAFGLFTGVLAGSYPAFFLSSFNPVAVLKGKFTGGKKNAGLRSTLVVFQFFISISLIIGTIVVYSQLGYIHNKNLGYDKSQVLVIENSGALGKNADAFKQQLLQDPRVVNVSTSGYLPAGFSYGNNFFVFPDNSTTNLVKTLRYEVDYNYIPTLGMKIVKGRNFSKQYGSDSSAVIVNETAMKAFGWKDGFEGHSISHTENDGIKHISHVIGVVKDFNFKSLHEAITPLVMTMASSDYGNIIVKINTKDIPGVLASVKSKWAAFNTDNPFTYSFLDDRFNNTYKAEENIGNILGAFAGLTIFVACLGLFGLATFTTAQRTKEIGIRKVLGANVTGLVSLLSKDFLKLVVVSFVIASPIAWYAMNKWLESFAYRIQISPWLFVLTGIVVALITITTISYQSIKAATANPVDAIKAAP